MQCAGMGSLTARTGLRITRAVGSTGPSPGSARPLRAILPGFCQSKRRPASSIRSLSPAGCPWLAYRRWAPRPRNGHSLALWCMRLTRCTRPPMASSRVDSRTGACPLQCRRARTRATAAMPRATAKVTVWREDMAPLRRRASTGAWRGPSVERCRRAPAGTWKAVLAPGHRRARAGGWMARRRRRSRRARGRGTRLIEPSGLGCPARRILGA
mmetsp:Transcript_75130/g.208969  ORF Transcript_75130/g.208969 Transcript_75130/m.208969 type:complete len:213 (+) Transcript_75130:506-1144(+)